MRTPLLDRSRPDTGEPSWSKSGLAQPARGIGKSFSCSVCRPWNTCSGGPVVALNIPIGQWHTVRALESGTVIMEVKEGPYEPTGEEDILAL